MAPVLSDGQRARRDASADCDDERKLSQLLRGASTLLSSARLICENDQHQQVLSDELAVGLCRFPAVNTYRPMPSASPIAQCCSALWGYDGRAS